MMPFRRQPPVNPRRTTYTPPQHVTNGPKYTHCGQDEPCNGHRDCACGAEVRAELEAAGLEVRR